MEYSVTLRMPPSEAADTLRVREAIIANLGLQGKVISGYYIIKRSIDARSRQVYIILSLKVFVDEAFQPRQEVPLHYQDVSQAAKEVIIIGAGPAGLFAALRCIEKGIRPVILERGKEVRARRRDLALLNKAGIVNPESNYCFGEGGAGTYSDGKLYTRASKRGDIRRILSIFVHFGADETILYDAHPHIGTNKLPQIITAMRRQIEACGGRILFETKATDLIIEKNILRGIRTAHEEVIPAQYAILCTGHSARDIFQMLHDKQIKLEAKPFALGVRIEHPQELVDRAQYHCAVRDKHLPPASYSLVQQAKGRGVFSFCMCPGGIIAPAATLPGELVVNGWSPSKRNNPFANSGLVVTVEEKDFTGFMQQGALAGMSLQQSVEKKAWHAGGGNLVAPAQRMTDFLHNKVSASLPSCSYLPGINSVNLQEVLPSYINEPLREALRSFGKKMKGYLTADAVLVATESRTSSPVRIPRDPETMQHPQIKGLYPCGEGAGYAGGIVSAAMDGEKVVNAIAVS